MTRDIIDAGQIDINKFTWGPLQLEVVPASDIEGEEEEGAKEDSDELFVKELPKGTTFG